MRTIHKVNDHGGNVVVSIREWEGIGTPDYYDITLDPVEADALISKISSSRDKANQNIKEAKEKRASLLEREIQERIEELKKLKEG